MERMKEKGLIALLSSGALAYLVVGLLFLAYATNTQAAPLGQETDYESLGWYYALYSDKETMPYTVIVVSTSIQAALTTRAMTECTAPGTGIDFSCVETRRPQLFGYIHSFVKEAGYEPTNMSLAYMFFEWCKSKEIDDSANFSLAVSVMVYQFIDYYEKAS